MSLGSSRPIMAQTLFAQILTSDHPLNYSVFGDEEESPGDHEEQEGDSCADEVAGSII